MPCNSVTEHAHPCDCVSGVSTLCPLRQLQQAFFEQQQHKYRRIDKPSIKLLDASARLEVLNKTLAEAKDAAPPPSKRCADKEAPRDESESQKKGETSKQPESPAMTHSINKRQKTFENKLNTIDIAEGSRVALLGYEDEVSLYQTPFIGPSLHTI